MRAGLSLEDLWLRYFEIAGDASPLELEAFLQGILTPDRREHDKLVHALNERFMELGDSFRLPYLFSRAPE